MTDLVTVANAEPVKDIIDDDGERCRHRIKGGLTGALDPVMREYGDFYVAWGRGEADFDDGVVSDNNITQVGGGDQSYSLKRIDLSDESIDDFYRGAANQMLWPAFLSFNEKVKDTEELWGSLKDATEVYGQAADEVAEEGSKFWIHDYHLCLLPEYLSSKREDSSIGYFHHIPFPSKENFGEFKYAEQVLEGLASADLVGLHTQDFVDNLLENAEELADYVDWDNQTYSINGKSVKAESFPLMIQYQDFHNISSPDLERENEVDELVLGVDRLDYAKNIPNKFRGFERFLDQNPGYVGDIKLLQKIAHSRTGIEDYWRELDAIRAEAERINQEWGNESWSPVELEEGHWDKEELIGRYRNADYCLITSLRDGMNIVAQEFVASQTDNSEAALILSKRAGASDMLDEVLELDPTGIIDIADSLERATEMSKSDKKRRMQKLQERIRENDSGSWAEEFLDELEKRSQPSIASDSDEALVSGVAVSQTSEVSED